MTQRQFTPAHAVRWTDALSAARLNATALPHETVGIGDSLGRVLAAPVVALQPVPHFASSAMDGWAVRGTGPWALTEAGELRDDEATVVATGGLLAGGTEAVLRSEWGEVESGQLRQSENARVGEPRAGANIRPVGAEAAADDLLIPAGTRLNPAHVAVAAIAGHDAITVAGRPRVTVLRTGDEVVSSGIPGPGQVRDAFGPQLPGLFTALGADFVAVSAVPDSLDSTVSALAAAAGSCDLVVTTGGTGRSGFDHVHDALSALGADEIISSLAVRPGSPTLLARLPGGCLVVGLPGNPLAAMIGVLLVARPAIEGMLGVEATVTTTVVAGVDIPGAPSVAFVPYRATPEGVRPATFVGSAMMRGLAGAAGVLVVPVGGARRGDTLEALPLPWAV